MLVICRSNLAMLNFNVLCVYKCFNIFQTIVNMRHFTFGFSRKLGTSCNSIATFRMVQLCWSMKEQELLKNTFQVHLSSCQFLVATKAKCPKTERQRPNYFYRFPWKAHCIMYFLPTCVAIWADRSYVDNSLCPLFLHYQAGHKGYGTWNMLRSEGAVGTSQKI